MLTRRMMLAAGIAVLASDFSAVAREDALPLPTLDEGPKGRESAVAVIAAGCFWGVQAVYQHTDGVLDAVSGYAGGKKWTAKYGVVSSGRTDHAEAVEITYDPRKISYGRLLQIMFAIVHDPTQVDRQGPDIGPQYRSAIFPVNTAQAEIARAYLDQLERSGLFPAPLATTVEMDKAFYAAEDYHQNYVINNPRQPYVRVHDLPKLAHLKHHFPTLYREAPVLVKASRGLGRLGTGSKAFYSTGRSLLGN